MASFRPAPGNPLRHMFFDFVSEHPHCRRSLLLRHALLKMPRFILQKALKLLRIFAATFLAKMPLPLDSGRTLVWARRVLYCHMNRRFSRLALLAKHALPSAKPERCSKKPRMNTDRHEWDWLRAAIALPLDVHDLVRTPAEAKRLEEARFIRVHSCPFVVELRLAKP